MPSTSSLVLATALFFSAGLALPTSGAASGVRVPIHKRASSTARHGVADLQGLAAQRMRLHEFVQPPVSFVKRL